MAAENHVEFRKFICKYYGQVPIEENAKFSHNIKIENVLDGLDLSHTTIIDIKIGTSTLTLNCKNKESVPG